MSQHAVCSVCAKYAALKDQAQDDTERQTILVAHAEHVRSTYQDRSVCALDEQMCADTARPVKEPQAVAAPDSLLHITIDGMDQVGGRGGGQEGLCQKPYRS